MKCDEVRELFGDYWDAPEGDWTRLRVDEHVKRCSMCAEEFKMWEESAELIQTAALLPEPLLPEKGALSSSVMNRIYEDERWRIPVANRLYMVPNRMRIRLTGLIACCMALFITGFMINLLFPSSGSEGYSNTAGMMNAGALGGDDAGFVLAGIDGVPVASIGDPIILNLPQIESYPNYMLVLSFLGMICTLLIMNWFARLRS